MDRDTARGLPFSKAFEKYLDGAPINTPARQALERMRSHQRRQSDEYRIAHALIIQGDTQTTQRYPSQVVRRALETVKEICASIPA